MYIKLIAAPQGGADAAGDNRETAYIHSRYVCFVRVPLFVCIHACKYTRMRAAMHPCERAFMCACALAHVIIHVGIRAMHACMRACSDVCVHIPRCACMHIIPI